MTPFLEALLLAVVQGLTEFLPVSSSGHLVLVQHVLGAEAGDLFLDVVLHCGTLGSVLVVYRREVVRLLRLDLAARRYVLALFVGTLPAVAVGLALRDLVEKLFHDPVTAAAALVGTGLILLSTRAAVNSPAGRSGAWEPEAPPLFTALLVGCAQALAICPGVSRSGSTIAASLWLRLPRAEAARFSFLLSVPAIAGALALQLMEGDLDSRTGGMGLIAAAVAAFGVGLLAIRWTRLAVIQQHFWKFAFYTIPVGVIGLLVLR